MDSMKIYNKLDRLKKDKGWSLNFLSAQAGISHSTLHSWKARHTMQSLEVLEGLCDALQISLAQLFGDCEYADD
ncbi:MAG: helix-turn-helix transcriptional regulator [Christensenellaceae bacterium]|jgi:transcriptional regulator with XRE-family HTH domain|nr:helix-turn-helix transcriptional regulator [Christensenellaceae bacterium]